MPSFFSQIVHRRRNRARRIKALLQRVCAKPEIEVGVLSGCQTINCLNGYSLAISLLDKRFYKALYSSDYLLCDGILIKWLCLFKLGRSVRRFTGPDFAEYIFQKADEIGGLKLLYYGSTLSVCASLKQNLQRRNTQNTILVESAPFCETVNDYMSQDAGHKIRRHGPDVVFLSMTAPKQEKLAALLAGSVSVSALVQVGAYFEFAAGTLSRCPAIFRYLGVEWMWRLLREPKKIWARILMLRWLL